jgi:hypothetical protein
MKITVHAGQRFLERVMNKEQYSYLDIDFAMRYLSKLLQDIVPTGSATSFVLPCFEQYRAICIEGRIVTIIPKDKTSNNDKKYKYRQYMSI